MICLTNLIRESNSKHPAAVNDTYSKAASSSQTGSQDEHQPDKNSPGGNRKIAAKASVWRNAKCYE